MNILENLVLRLRRFKRKAPRENDKQIQERIIRRLTANLAGNKKFYAKAFFKSKVERRKYQSHIDRTAHALGLAKIQLQAMA